MMDIYRFKELGFRLPAGSGLIKTADVQALDTAQDIIATAKAQAAKIVEEAKLHLESERQRGFAEGQQAAENVALERLLKEQDTLEASLTEIESSLARLVVASVRKIIHDFEDVDAALALISSGLTKVRREKRVQIRIPEALTAELKPRVDDLINAFPNIEFVDIVEDPSLEAPNIILETAVGRIDCDLNANFATLEQSITQVTNPSSDREDD